MKTTLITIASAIFLIVACGGGDSELIDEPREESGESDTSDGDSPGDSPEDSSPQDRAQQPPYDRTLGAEIPVATPPDLEVADPSGSDEPNEESPADSADSEPYPTDADLQCADDPDICRFCGPPIDVVESCSDGDETFECRVYELVNERRADVGLAALDYDGTLAQSAMIHAMDLNYCDYFAHDSLDGTTFFDRCVDNGYPETCTGENIGGGQSTPEDVVEAWMESPGHRANILYEHHTEVGIAFYEGEGTYGRYWLKHFGRR